MGFWSSLILLLSIFHYVLGFGKRLFSGDHNEDVDWNKEVLGDEQVVTETIIIILFAILIVIVGFQIARFWQRLYR